MSPDLMLAGIDEAEVTLTDRFGDKLEVNHDLDRSLVSFQGNKAENGHRWCKYKEGFSAALVRYILSRLAVSGGPVLDPFAGSGTTLFVATQCGLDAVGIELLPSSSEIIEVRDIICHADAKPLAKALRAFARERSWQAAGRRQPIRELAITKGAYPEETKVCLERYLYEAQCVGNEELARVFRFAALCVLESVSYTRKDGQYLRWDYRSGRRQGTKRFDKGKILDFTTAVVSKLLEIADDLAPDHRLFDDKPLEPAGRISLLRGSCLDVIPTLGHRAFSAAVTSPPYCNRYDYTRTYALELALLGVDEVALKDLRQAMVSCTVENKRKEHLRARFSASTYDKASRAFEGQKLLQLTLEYLERCRVEGTINNTGIPRMVRNYFWEMTLVIAECARTLKPGAPLVMVNDNVRYQGANVPVDLILSDIASQVGFDVERIWVLPRGKGNSSQQMGKHGRAELRKCVYVWRRLRTNTQEHGHAGQGTARRVSEGIRRARQAVYQGTAGP